MAEALVDEINDPATGLVTRDYLRAELAELRSELFRLIITVFGVQIALIGVLVTVILRIFR